jgi:hypothetical protein
MDAQPEVAVTLYIHPRLVEPFLPEQYIKPRRLAGLTYHHTINWLTLRESSVAD